MARIAPLSGFPEWLPTQRVVEQYVLDTLREVVDERGRPFPAGRVRVLTDKPGFAPSACTTVAKLGNPKSVIRAPPRASRTSAPIASHAVPSPACPKPWIPTITVPWVMFAIVPMRICPDSSAEPEAAMSAEAPVG